MRPVNWNVPVNLSPAEQKIVSRIKRAKLFIFLREIRHTKSGLATPVMMRRRFMGGDRTAPEAIAQSRSACRFSQSEKMAVGG
ncbi:hypothetical protein ACE1CI_05955 [Aerosakkonemataceae cyanobacterium BLCC-F50]|uniref:Uncharacterized protein n=1 Tax=Floridaenema flaviceps BLCC-F50 TaxID=3153642 RepID=A0ABV4XLB0_9CYAN